MHRHPHPRGRGGRGGQPQPAGGSRSGPRGRGGRRQSGHRYVYGPGVEGRPGSRGVCEPHGGGHGGPVVPGAGTETGKERVLITEEQARKAEIVTVSHLDLHVLKNSKDHKTKSYRCTQGHRRQPVFRRGQEFMVTMTFNQPYKKDIHDLFFLISADEDETKPEKKNLKVRFQADEKGLGRGGEDPYHPQHQDWAATAEDAGDPNMLRFRVYIPGDCAVGVWHLKVLTKQKDRDDVYVYVCPRPVVILFNPWSQADQVHFPQDQELLEEYVLNDAGVVFCGCFPYWIDSFHWVYGQFEEGILDICLFLLKKAFDGRMTPAMGDAVLVTRALSKIVNCQDDDGVLMGNWTDDFSGGKTPGSWKASVPILTEFFDSKAPVKYGQCWVFSHVLTTVCRALGLPCRSVTNFDSAHDTDNTCTVDVFVDTEGNPIKCISSDSIWNFHVWNEVWILRPDLGTSDYDGWHVLDATPQEQSMGVMQCGPCPVEAVRKGELTVGYDTSFIFSEVNADVVHWAVGPSGDFDVVSDCKKEKVGHAISTKRPDCLMSSPSDDIMDITDTYKYPEGSEEERAAVRRGVRFGRYGSRLYQESTALTVSFDRTDHEAQIGKDLHLTAHVKNVSSQDREVLVTMAARATRYWDTKDDAKVMAKNTSEPIIIKAESTETFKLTVTAEQYQKLCCNRWNVHAFACARDLQEDMPYTAQHKFPLRCPPVCVNGPTAEKSGQAVTVTMSVTNPLNTPLTDCEFEMSGNLVLVPEPQSPWILKYGTYVMKYGSDFKLGPLEQLSMSVCLKGEWEEEDEGTKTMVMSFYCQALNGMNGAFKLKRKV